MSNLDEAAELICDRDIREDRRAEDDAELIRNIGELIALAMWKQHERTMQQLEEIAVRS